MDRNTASVNEPKTYTCAQVALLAGVGRRLAYELAARNEIPGKIVLGRRIVFSKAAIDRWLDGGLDESPLGPDTVGS